MTLDLKVNSKSVPGLDCYKKCAKTMTALLGSLTNKSV